MSPVDDKGELKPRARRTRASAAVAEPDVETKPARAAKNKTKAASSRNASDDDAVSEALPKRPARRTSLRKNATKAEAEPQFEEEVDERPRGRSSADDNRDPEVGEYDRTERSDGDGRYNSGHRNGYGGGGHRGGQGGGYGGGGGRPGGNRYGGGGGRHGGGGRPGPGGPGGYGNQQRRNNTWQDRPRVQRPPVDPVAAAKKATEVLDFLAKRLVTKPDNVIVELFADEEDRPVIELIVDKEDIGKVIGRNGRVAHALRTLVRATAETRISVDILDSEEAAEDALEGDEE